MVNTKVYLEKLSLSDRMRTMIVSLYDTAAQGEIVAACTTTTRRPSLYVGSTSFVTASGITKPGITNPPDSLGPSLTPNDTSLVLCPSTLHPLPPNNTPSSSTSTAQLTHVDTACGQEISNAAVAVSSTDVELKVHLFDVANEEEQVEAQRILAEVGVVTTLAARMAVRWSKTEGGATKLLYQCKAGTYGDSQHAKEETFDPNNDSKQHHFMYTACPAHLDVIKVGSKIRRIVGIACHNTECGDPCKDVVLELHPKVRADALEMRKRNVDFHDIGITIASRVKSGYYVEELSKKVSKYRWILEPGDQQSITCDVMARIALSTKEPAERNLDGWMKKGSETYKPEMARMMPFYIPRTADDKGNIIDDRLEMVIVDEEMKKTAWKYGHHSQIVMDGTFGVCSKRMLLFVVMVIDEKGRGLPVGILLFSAKSTAKATCGSYDTDILTRLLGEWKSSINASKYAPADESFQPYVAMTDTDHQERNALSATWIGIKLLICRWHLRQCWTNKRKKNINGKGGSKEGRFHVYWLVRKLEENILQAKNVDVALEACDETITVLRRDLEEFPSHLSKAFVEKACMHIEEYLIGYWLQKKKEVPAQLFSAFSDAGLTAAAAKIDNATIKILTTSGHAESFNAVLKRVYLAKWRRNGRALRLDLFVHQLCFNVLPHWYLLYEGKRKNDSLRDAYIYNPYNQARNTPSVAAANQARVEAHRVRKAANKAKARKKLQSGKFTKPSTTDATKKSTSDDQKVASSSTVAPLRRPKSAKGEAAPVEVARGPEDEGDFTAYRVNEDDMANNEVFVSTDEGPLDHEEALWPRDHAYLEGNEQDLVSAQSPMLAMLRVPLQGSAEVEIAQPVAVASSATPTLTPEQRLHIDTINAEPSAPSGQPSAARELPTAAEQQVTAQQTYVRRDLFSKAWTLLKSLLNDAPTPQQQPPLPTSNPPLDDDSWMESFLNLSAWLVDSHLSAKEPVRELAIPKRKAQGAPEGSQSRKLVAVPSEKGQGNQKRKPATRDH